MSAARVSNVPLRVSQRTLERLEWPEVALRLGEHARTPGVRARCALAGASPDSEGAWIFALSSDEARARMAETSEARALLDANELPPLGGIPELAVVLRRLAKGGLLGPGELLDLGAVLAALESGAGFFRRRSELAPRLAALAESIEPQRQLFEDIEWCVDPEGEVRDAASPALAEARSTARGLAGELQQRISRLLHDPAVAPHLSDLFYTVRGDRYVLPVRADARPRVPGIVHDASASGTTLFVEPEALVETNNRLKQAELAAERESKRILRQLSEQAAAARPAIEAGLAALEALDLAMARGHLSRDWNAVEPALGEDGVFVLPQLRHPLLAPATAVANDLRLGDGFSVLVLSGPNAGGKTVAMKAVALCALCAHAGLHVPAADGARVALVQALLSDIGDAQSLRESLSTFSAHMANLARIVEAADERALVVLDEIGDGTDPGEGAALAQAVLETLAETGARVIATTHFNLLKEMAEVDSRFANASFEFDPETLLPTYRLRLGAAGVSSATSVARRMGLREDVVGRAQSLLEREDRRLDRMLAELSASRASLERERSEAMRLRTESEVARSEYREKLERLNARRDKLFQEMRDDLDRAFREAHGEIAGVIRELQRGGGARDAAAARERLVEAQRRADRTQEQVARPAEPVQREDAIDWSQARPGDVVRVRGGRDGVLLALPDRRARAAVRVGSARLLVPAERLVKAAPAPALGERARVAHVRVESAPRPAAEDVETRCDLRGLRVEAALERVEDVLDRAASAGRTLVLFVHGLGTGALRDAVRAHLAQSPYVADYSATRPEEGGEGVTLARLQD